MNPVTPPDAALDALQPYPFQRLAALLDGLPPGAPPIPLTIGEPQHPLPEPIGAALCGAVAGFSRYPTTQGDAALREACVGWLQRRYGVTLDPERAVLPVAGTREALFAIAQLARARLPSDTRRRRVLIPNPFYQIYEGAALLAGFTPTFYPLDAERGFLPDPDAIPNPVWAETALVYVCNPGNPAGACMDRGAIDRFVERAREHGVVVAADECYAEIHAPGEAPADAPGLSGDPRPPGFLQATAAPGDDPHAGVLVFHSLSKRSNAPGLRSGFVAGDRRWLADFLRYRTYHGCTLPPPIQVASAVAWRDDDHVEVNRRLYATKLDHAVARLVPWLDVQRPAAGFYLWPRLPDHLYGGDDARFARALWAATGVKVLPGRYLAREVVHAGEDGPRDPARGRLRLALVADPDTCHDAIERLAGFLERL